MIILLSPAKSMNYKTVPKWVTPTQNMFLDEADTIASKLKTLSKPALQKTLQVSEAIAELNHERFKRWNHSEELADELQPAIWAYSGDVYNGLDVQSFSKQDGAYAQKHLVILSGLYGIVRPYDLILPYRLEMGTKLKIGRSKDLYEYWGTKLATVINHSEEDVILNCASQEYSKAVLPHISDSKRIISPIFMQETAGLPKQKALFSKFMRGVMAKWVIQNQISDSSDILSFEEEGFTYSKDLTQNANEPVFLVSKDFSLLGRFTG